MKSETRYPSDSVTNRRLDEYLKAKQMAEHWAHIAYHARLDYINSVRPPVYKGLLGVSLLGSKKEVAAAMDRAIREEPPR